MKNFKDLEVGDYFKIDEYMTFNVGAATVKENQFFESRVECIQNIIISCVDGVFIMNTWDECDFGCTWSVIDEKLYNELIRFKQED